MNKVKFGLKNVHYALRAIGEDGSVTFETPKRIPGAVSMSLSPDGETTPFYADDSLYFTTISNNGYTGNLEVAVIPDDFRVEVLGESLDTKKVQFEDAKSQPKAFALLFEFDGDAAAIKHVLYNCKATRPTIEGETKAKSIEAKTETLELVAAPGEDGYVKAKTGDQTDAQIVENWYKTVYTFSEVIQNA